MFLQSASWRASKFSARLIRPAMRYTAATRLLTAQLVGHIPAAWSSDWLAVEIFPAFKSRNAESASRMAAFSGHTICAARGMQESKSRSRRFIELNAWQTYG